MNLNLLMILLADVLNASLSAVYRKVTECPNTQSDWEARGLELNCSSTLKYHCLQTWANELGELCYTKRAIFTNDGCPRLEHVKNNVIISQYRCPERVAVCPEGSYEKGTYYTDELYKYPGCFFIFGSATTSQRETYRITEKQQETYSGIDKTYSTLFLGEQKGTREAVTDRTTMPTTSTPSSVYIIGGGILGIVIVSLIVFIIIQSRNIKQFKVQLEGAKYMPSVPYNATASHPYHEADIYNEIVESDKTDSGGSAEYVDPNPPMSKARVPADMSGNQRVNIAVKLEPERDEDRSDYIDVIGDEKKPSISDKQSRSSTDISQSSSTEPSNMKILEYEEPIPTLSNKESQDEKYFHDQDSSICAYQDTANLEIQSENHTSTNPATNDLQGRILTSGNKVLSALRNKEIDDDDAKISTTEAKRNNEVEATNSGFNHAIVEINPELIENQRQLQMDKDDYLMPHLKGDTDSSANV